jgi:hypothetical protein
MLSIKFSIICRVSKVYSSVLKHEAAVIGSVSSTILTYDVFSKSLVVVFLELSSGDSYSAYWRLFRISFYFAIILATFNCFLHFNEVLL